MISMLLLHQNRNIKKYIKEYTCHVIQIGFGKELPKDN